MVQEDITRVNASVWTALTFVIMCYGILLVVALFVAVLIIAVRWATAPHKKAAELPEVTNGGKG